MPKRENKYKCSSCQQTYPAWEGICRNCGGINTVAEVARSTTSQKTVRRRWQRVERDTARSMQDADGPDPMFRNIASSTGKVGHLTGLRFDAVSRTYATEVKNRPLPAWLITAWVLIQQRALDMKKNPLLHVKPPNMPGTFKLNGENLKTGTLAIITQDHHLELVKEARILGELEEIINNDKTYKKLAEQLWLLRHK